MTVLARIIRHEGFLPYAYEDSLGYTTIGHGICIDKRKGCGITEEESLYLVNNRITRFRRDLFAKLPWTVDMPLGVQEALIEMVYQMGINGLLTFKKALALLKDRKYSDAADEFLDSRWFDQTPNRAREVVSLIRAEEK